ncbi:hypothetical protein BDFB_011579, partial [Asbolus verrucosus]
MVRNNKSDQICVACASSKLDDNKPVPKSGFGDKFKPPVSTWECTSCLIRNKNELDKCAACAASKSDKILVTSNFGDKFKPSNDTRKCSTCTRIETRKHVWRVELNDKELERRGFGEAFKVKEGEWKSSCFVKNKSEVDTCGVHKSASTSKKLSEINKEEEKKPEKVATITSITSASESITSTIVSSNPLLKPNEKLPEKAVPPPVGFMIDVDNSSSQKQISKENIVTSISKTEAPVVFSSSFEPVKPALPIPTFQFKPAAISGDINKPKDLFGSKLAESGNLFSNPALIPTFKFNVKPSEDSIVTTTDAVQPQAGIFKFGTEISQSVFLILEVVLQARLFSGFNFSSTNTGLNFGNIGKIEGPPFNPTPTNVFGSTTTGAAKNGSFNFGTNSNNSNQKAVFSLGASQTNTSSFGAQNSSGFNFGAPV